MTAPATAREAQKACACVVDWGKCSRCERFAKALDAAVARALNEMADSILAVPLETAMEVYHALRQRALRAPEAGG